MCDGSEQLAPPERTRGRKRRVQIALEAQAIFCRRRH
jgi:hypothetical protein